MTKTKAVEKHLPAVAPKKTGRRGVRPVDYENPEPLPPSDVVFVPPEPEPPTSEEVKEFLDGAAATREKRAAKKKPEIVKDPQKGKTERLPGMQDPAIEELEDCAREYANTRDDRMLLLGKEVELKEDLLNLMKKHKKTVYLHDGVEIKIVHEKEAIKVKVKRDDD
jgi:hypothetical protein